jgi:acetyl-CoA acetyltransferase
MTQDAILGGKRTPMGICGRTERCFSNRAWGYRGGALESTGVGPEEIDHTIIGNALQTSGDDMALARRIKSRCAFDRPALTVNRLCGSGIRQLFRGAQVIRSAKHLFGGRMESMSQAPHVIRGARDSACGSWKIV